VQLHLTIDASGAVQNVATISGPSSLVQSAADALRQWQFKPTLLDGKPVQTEADIAVVFWFRPAPQRSESKSQ